jgi:hypothetical protein
MYSRKTWGGSVDPFILTKFEKTTEGSDPDPIVSFVIFEWHDEKFIGRPRTPESVEVSLIVPTLATALLTIQSYRRSTSAMRRWFRLNTAITQTLENSS